MSILDRIVDVRREKVSRLGAAMGARLPAERQSPLTPFGTQPFLICEIKRFSPSRGGIAPGVDAVDRAGAYAQSGARTLSVLTEEDHFGGSLEDLMRVKNRFPGLCVLRKDFLLSEADVDVSYLAGADAVLLIAALHTVESLRRLHRRARGLGMEVLLEVHDRADLDRARHVRPRFTGFNARDLTTFRVDPAGPIGLLQGVDWQTTPVFESGIDGPEQARLALASGFGGLLVGEAVMRDPDLARGLQGLFSLEKRDFWLRLFSRRVKDRPLVKVCGITREEDARLAARLGADLLGFVFAPSPRRASPGLLRRLRGLDILKVGVVTGADGDASASARTLLDEGCLDALQLHGEEGPDECYGRGFPYYKAVRVGGPEDIEGIAAYRCPRVLVDARVPGRPGGTGRRIPDRLVDRVREHHPLWLAGGLHAGNVEELVGRFAPELVDGSSGLESSPGVKDGDMLARFIESARGGDR